MGETKVTGRKRHIAVDTQGNPLAVVVHAANLSDRDGAWDQFPLGIVHIGWVVGGGCADGVHGESPSSYATKTADPVPWIY